MSQYSTVKAFFKYSTEKECRELFEKLNSEGYSTSDSKGTDIFMTSTQEAWKLVIPEGYYRNLNRFFDLLKEKAVNWNIIETTTDGVFVGTISTPNEEDEFELEEWVTSKPISLTQSRPDKSDYETESAWFDEYTDWQATVENKFMAYMSGYLDYVLTY